MNALMNESIESFFFPVLITRNYHITSFFYQCEVRINYLLFYLSLSRCSN
jgi:hypothetical protein